MITTHEQLEHAEGAVARLERALLALRTRVGEINSALFHALAEDYRANILRIRAEIDEYLGLDTIGNAAVPLWMVLEGEMLPRHEVSSRLLSDWLDRLRMSLYGMTAYLETGRMQVGGRPIASLLRATDPQVVAVAPGSVRVGLRMPRIEQQLELSGEDREEPTVYRALEQLFLVAEWAVSGLLEPPYGFTNDPDTLTVAARFAAKLAPTSRATVRSVTFVGPLVPRSTSIRMTSESRDRLDGLVGILSHVTEETIVGQIREIDLDRRRVILRERGPGQPDVRCFLSEALVPVAERLLDRVVTVRGLVSSGAPDRIDAHSIEAVQ